MRRILVTLLTLALVVAACGDDDSTPSADERTGAETTSTTADPSTTTTAAPDDGDTAGGDQAVAEAGLLQLADFPAGWEEQPAGEDEDDEDSQRRIAACIGVDYERIYGDNGTGDADSPTFVSPEGAEVSNSVGIEVSEEDAVFAFETLSSDLAIDCIAEEFQDFIAESAAADDVEVGEISINRISFPDFGDGSAAFRVTVPLSTQGQSIDVYVDVVVVRVGRGGLTAQVVSLFEPFDSDELAGYTGVAVDRLTQAFAAA